jgi:hypothetical protein
MPAKCFIRQSCNSYGIHFCGLKIKAAFVSEGRFAFAELIYGCGVAGGVGGVGGVAEPPPAFTMMRAT